MASDFVAAGRTPTRLTPGWLLARQDRITVWALPTSFLIVLGMGFLFTFYDIFDINVSFIQTCIEIVPKCNPEVASRRVC